MKKVKEYAFNTVLDTSYEDAILRVTSALKEEGFWVLAQIDVKAGMLPILWCRANIKG